MNKFKFWKRPKNANNQAKDDNTQPRRTAVFIDTFRFFLKTRRDLLAECFAECNLSMSCHPKCGVSVCIKF